MRNLFLPLFGLLLVVSSCNRPAASATNGTAPATAPTAVATSGLAPTVSDTSLLWRISGPGITAPSYLFGTIHLIPEEDYFMPPKVVRAVNDAEEIVFEIDPRDMQDPTMMISLMGKINMRGDTSLRDLLTDAEYEVVEDHFSQMGLPFAFLQRMKPMFLSAMVGQDLDMSGGMGGGMPGMSGMKSYEFELTELAEQTGKEINGLETIDFQLGLFDSIPYRAQAQMLYQAVEQSNTSAEDGETPDQLSEMVALYKRQAVAEMASTIGEESAEIARFEELLLTRRNENWAPTIREMAQRTEGGPVIFAVGAGHLGGQRGVVALLREMGLSVEPIY